MKKLLFILLIATFVLAWYSKTSSTAKVPVADSLEMGDSSFLPAPKEGIALINYLGFTVGYDTERLIPAWTSYQLTGPETQGEVPRASGFSMDLNYKGRQAMREDYSYSGWDKGHMGPAADMKWSQKAMYQCFYLTNICPQNHSMNAGPWLSLEKWCRDKAVKFGSVQIVTGPVVGTCKNGTIGDRKVCVPDRFYKAILRRDSLGVYNAIAFVMDNDSLKHPVPKSCITVDQLETMTGLDFFHDLPDSVEQIVESKMDYGSWIR